MKANAPVCVVSRRDQAGEWKEILIFPPQPRRAKGDPIAPCVIDIVALNEDLD